MKQVFVSGCFDILHAGHLQFFREARSLGDHLTVSFASANVLWNHKQRRPSLPDEHKKALLESLEFVDQVVIGSGKEIGFDFEPEFLRLRPDILAVTSDDLYASAKQALCAQTGTEYHVLAKTAPEGNNLSTSDIVRRIRAPQSAPLRVDFAGGWLDVPRLARTGAFIVNCAISPLVSLGDWTYRKQSGLGGSGAWALLNGCDAIAVELDQGVGWQDPAVIRETGCCVWRSGSRPQLDFKRDGRFLIGKMAIHWTGETHDTAALAENAREYSLIQQAGKLARDAVLTEDINLLCRAVSLSYKAQISEGMAPLPEGNQCLARKYCGSGWGGYALYLFASAEARSEFIAQDTSSRRIVEPFVRTLADAEA